MAKKLYKTDAEIVQENIVKTHTPGIYEMGTHTPEANDLLLFLTSGSRKLLEELDEVFETVLKFITGKSCGSRLTINKVIETAKETGKPVVFDEMYSYSDIHSAMFKRARWFVENLWKSYQKEVGSLPEEHTFDRMVIRGDIHSWLYRHFEEWVTEKKVLAKE